MLRVAEQTGWTTIHEGIANISRTPFPEDREANFLVETSAAFELMRMVRLCNLGCVIVPHHDNLALHLEKSTTWF